MDLSSNLVTQEEMENDPSACVVNENMSIDAIPDLDRLMEKIVNMLEYMNTPKMKQLKLSNAKEYEYVIFHNYREQIPTKIIDLLTEDISNLGKLIEMFETD